MQATETWDNDFGPNFSCSPSAMSAQPDLFAEAPTPTDAAATPKTVAAVSLKMEGRQLSPEQKRFNQLLAHLEILAGKIENARALGDVHRSQCASALRPMEQRREQLTRDMALWLDERLRHKGLSRPQQHMARRIICSLSEPFAGAGDEAMRRLHDSHSTRSLSDKEKGAAAAAQAMLEKVLGVDMDGASDLGSVEEMLQAGLHRFQEHSEAQRARQAGQSARKAGRGPTSRQKAAQRQEQDAEGALRTIYRQLASALHPDRESNPETRASKTLLMTQANVAYQGRDLMALLKLQLRIEQVDPDAVARLAGDKLQTLTHLLKKQAQVLQQNLRGIELQLIEEFDLPGHAPVSAASLQRHLLERKHGLQADIRAMETDLQRVRDDAELKRWLKEQHDLAVDPGNFF